MPIPQTLDLLLAKLFNRINYERQTGFAADDLRLQNMLELLQRLDNPHLKYPVIHVAGTKGKGSVACMIGKILMKTGRRIGVYSSPHLESIHQRISINGSPIDDQDLFHDLQLVESAADEIESQQVNPSDGGPTKMAPLRTITFFEVITAAGFLHFARLNVDLAVMEVGMGGRLDSTNVVQPAVSVITSISLDHTQHLGDTIAKIAFEKAGIIKHRVPVVSGVRQPEAAEVIEAVAANRQSSLFQLGDQFETQSNNGHEFDFWFNSGSNLNDSQFKKLANGSQTHIKNIRPGMLGRHQQINGSLAAATCCLLNQAGWNITQQAMAQGIAEAVLPGRTEIVNRFPIVILDIAHNPASVEALVETLNDSSETNQASNRILIVSISKDKDYRSMLQHFAPNFDVIVCTKFLNNPRARSPAELAVETARICQQLRLEPQIFTEYGPASAWEKASELATSNDLICVAGSAFLVAEIRSELPLLLNQLRSKKIHA